MVARRKIRWGIVAVLMVALIVVWTVFFVNSSAKNQEIDEIEGVAVTSFELNREMERCRTLVINQLVTEYAITDMTDFWKKKYKGQTALEIMRQKTLDTLIVFKVQERLLKERNLWPYNHYSEFLRDLEKTNEAREKAAKEKATIYGPINYTERAFFDYQFGNAIIRLKKQLVEEGELLVEEEALLSYFDKLKNTVYQQGERFEDYTRQVRDAYIEKIYALYIIKQKKQVEISPTRIN